MSNKKDTQDRKKLIRQSDHMTTPPRMEGKVKNAMSGSKQGRKKAPKAE
jgi:hypothetical protein